ncbi:MAG: hypothetical protein Kow0092_11740 [Deferrisomatales bacterium]
MSFRTATGAALLLAVLSFPFDGPPPARAAMPWAAGPAFEARLTDAVAAGRLTPAEADLYRLYRVRAPERLPAAYRPAPAALQAARGGEGAFPRGFRCATRTLRAVRARLEAMPPGLRAEAEALLAGGRGEAPRAARRGAAKAVRHELARYALTENFSVEWGPALTDPDGTTPPADDDGDGVPDVVERWADVLEASWAAIEEMGFAHPVLDGELVQIFLGNSDDDAQIDNLSRGFYGLTNYDAGTDPAPYIVVANDFSALVGSSDEGTLLDAMKVTAAHELFHVFHFLYEPEVWEETQDDWWLEASSTWMEDEVFDDVDDVVNYYQYFKGPGGWASFADEGLPVPFGNGDYDVRAYGASLFAKYLQEHVGGRGSMREVWELIRGPAGDGSDGLRILDALDAYAAARGFADLEALFPGFAAANAVMDYEEGAHYGSVPVAGGLTSDPEPDPLPDYLGATYLKAADGDGGARRVDLDGEPAGRWGLALLLVREAGYGLAVASVDENGAPGAAVSAFRAGDTLYAVPCYLDPVTGSTAYSTAPSSPAPGDATPPGAVGALAVRAASGGFDASWTAPGEADVAGYVVRWGAGSRAARTLYGPVTSVEVRGLAPGSYTVEVWPYDHWANEGPPESADVATDPAPSGEVLSAALLEVGVNDGGGGGGGGGGCFLEALHR